MKNESLLKRVESLGFPLFVPEADENANLTLADMVRSGDLRLWEGFPVVLVNCAEKGLFDHNEVNSYLKKPFEKASLDLLMALSLALYKFLKLEFSWFNKFYKFLSEDAEEEFESFLEELKKGNNLMVAGKTMSVNRLKSVFSNYFTRSQEKLSDLLMAKDELNLEYSLSQVFSPKQKELFFKKLRREKLTKTEKEYFSRSVKKKVQALANPELHRLARRVLE